jgi:HAD superfamily hydrolase (TIGR01549 family)
MTTTPGSPPALDAVIIGTRDLLLDFDGPVCSIFAGLSSAAAATELRDLITVQGVTLTGEVTGTADPFAVFGYAATISPELAAQVEARMTELELAAVGTAQPTPYVHELVTSCRESGRSLTVVSNNSLRAVRAYLTSHALDRAITFVVARTSADPGQLKPSPHLITQAITANGADPAACALIGDTDTDIHAARLAGVASIGYANKPGKVAQLTDAGADAIVTSLADIALTLRARPLRN